MTPSAPLRRSLDLLAAVLWLSLVLTLGTLDGAGLATQVGLRLPESGTLWPVTAVLLNFRGYDTLLETAVLLLAVLASFSLHGAVPPAPGRALAAPGPALSSFVPILVPVMVLVSGYLLCTGSHGPGGAFQAGAILAGAGVLLVLAERGGWIRLGAPGRLALTGGFFVFLTLAALGPLRGGSLLSYPPGAAPALLVLLETLLTVSIGAILLGLYISNPQPPTRGRE